MRVLVFFDLPTETPEDRRHYRQFRKLLMRNGFLMMQESVYCRLVPSSSAESTAMEAVRKNKPPKGLVQMLSITEKQFARMEYLVGEKHTDTLDTDERLVIF